LSAAKVIMGVVARDCMKGIVGLEPLIKMPCRWHPFPVDVTLAAGSPLLDGGSYKSQVESNPTKMLMYIVSVRCWE